MREPGSVGKRLFFGSTLGVDLCWQITAISFRECCTRILTFFKVFSIGEICVGIIFSVSPWEINGRDLSAC